MHAYNTKLATAMLGRQAKLPTKQSSLGHNAWYSVNPRQSRNRTALNQKKKSPPAIQYPEMVAADYDPSEPVRSLTPIVQELIKIKKRVNEVLIKYETPNPRHGQYETLLNDRDHHEKELIRLMVDIDQYSEERDDVLCELIESFSEQLASLDDLNHAQVIEKKNSRTFNTASDIDGGTLTNLTDSIPSLPDECSITNIQVSKTIAQDKAPGPDSIDIKTAKTLARVFSLEDRLKQDIEFSQDEFSSKIPQFLMEDEALLEEVMTEQVLMAVKALKLYIVIERCLENIRQFCTTIPREVKEIENLMSKSGDRLRNMYLGYFSEVSEYVKQEATILRRNMAKVYIILDSYDPQQNSQIQKEDEYIALINSVFQCSLLMEKKLCTFFEGYSDVQERILEAGKEVREILQSKAHEAQALTVKMSQLFDRPNGEVSKLQEEMAMLNLAVRCLSHSLAQKEETHKMLGALMELSQCVDTLAKRGRQGFTLQISDLLEKNVVAILEKLGIRIPSQIVCMELYKMGFNATTSLMELCDIMNEDSPQIAHGAKSEMKTKYVVPKFGTKSTARPTGLIKKRASTSFQHRPKRSQAKISVKKAKNIISKTEVIRPSLTRKESRSHQKTLMMANSQLQSTGSHDGDADINVEDPKAVVTTKQEQERIVSKKSLLQNRALLLSNTDPHDSNLQCHEENMLIRYSRRMPVFPPVSSSHANAQPVTSNQCRVSLVGEGGEKKARFTGPIIARQSTLVEGKRLLVPPKLSVVSLKLPKL